jgi:pimeloyl-ACP methyl ester carboxylesterase
MSQSGILYVTMQPHSSLPPEQMQDWYQNEHGPGRLRLPFFPNGFRYQANDNLQHEFMAIYDVSDMQNLLAPEYTTLRQSPKQSQRERDTMKQIDVDRRFYDLGAAQASPEFSPLEGIEHEGKTGNIMIAAHITLKDNSQRGEYERWFDEEHVPLLAKVPGWRRSRRFVTSSLEPDKEFEVLGLHEYALENGLGGPEFKAALNTPWRDRIFENVKDKKRREWKLFYTFGPAPRDLASPTSDFEFGQGTTRTLLNGAGGSKAVESYITTPDNVKLNYRLEGNPDPQAPIIVLVNSVLVDYGIWDDFLQDFLSRSENKKYRVLRYNARGREAAIGDTPVTVDLLAKDVTTLLDALRVPRAAAVIGVSLGGATTLDVALKYPSRLASFIACDTNSSAPASNSKAWDERVDMAAKEAATSSTGEPIVGENLAEITVRRWFVKDSYVDAAKSKDIERVKTYIMTNSLEGFRKGVKALHQYDFKEEMKSAKTRGLFVSGAGDGVLPQTMKAMAEGYGDGKSELKLIESAGHLPMVEQPKAFADVVTTFLNGS